MGLLDDLRERAQRWASDRSERIRRSFQEARVEFTRMLTTDESDDLRSLKDELDQLTEAEHLDQNTDRRGDSTPSD